MRAPCASPGLLLAREECRKIARELLDCPLPYASHARVLATQHDPWVVLVEGGCAGQRAFRRSRAPLRVVVAGRQSGKTHEAAEEVVGIILSRPGTESCLLMPTYKSTKGALRHLKRALEPLGDYVHWREVDKLFVFANGSLLYIRTADDKTGIPTRGLTIDGALWVDEASFVPRSAWDAAQNTQAAVENPLAIVTTTARGRKGSWVFDLAREAYDELGNGDPDVEFFRFRTTDSPYHNPRKVAKIRERLGRAKAAEELDAIFNEDSEAPFRPEDIETAFESQRIPLRGERIAIGVDLGKEKTWTVLTALNEFGEAWVLDRFQPKRSWQDAVDRIVEQAQRLGAIVVIDTAHGGGAGQVVHDLVRDQLGETQVFGVNTGIAGTKGALIEVLKLDFESERIKVEAAGEKADELRHELTFFPAPERKMVGVKEVLVYKPPADDEDRFDDCVISLSLAKWGQENGWERSDPTKGDFTHIRRAARAQQGDRVSGQRKGGTKKKEFGGFGSVGGGGSGGLPSYY